MTAITRRMFVGAALSAGVSPAILAADKPIKLVVNNWLASTSPTTQGSFVPWAEYVEKETSGRVVVELHHGAVLGGSKAVLDDVRGGVYDFGMAIPSYYYDSEYFKLLTGELPFALPPDSVVGSKVVSEYARTYCADIFKSLGVQNGSVSVSDPYIILSRRPIRSLDDMKNLRLRALGKAWVRLYEDWGAIGVPIQPEDAYTALDRGTIDAVYYSTSGTLGWKYYEVAPYITVMETPVVVQNMIFSTAFMNKLPADLKRQFVENLGPKFGEMMAANYNKQANIALGKMSDYFKDKGKGEIIHLSPEERARFVTSSKNAWHDWVSEANKRGYGGDKLMEGFKGVLEQNGLKSPF